MKDVGIWQFARENADLLGVISAILLSVGFFLLFRALRRRSERKLRLQRIATCWLATLSELSVALDRMQETTRSRIRDRQRPFPLGVIHKSDIYTHRWLREGFLLMAGDQAGASLVGSVNRDCDFFLWNVNQTTNARVRMLDIPTSSHADLVSCQQNVDDFDDATITFACNHHHEMVEDWKQSAVLLNDFCVEHNLGRGAEIVVPVDIPTKWQRNDTKPWTIGNLAHVGEDTWEP